MRATTTKPEEKVDATVNGEGDAGDLSSYIPMGEDRRIQAVCRDWVHSNNGEHLNGGISDDEKWKKSWQKLQVIPARRLDASHRKFGKRLCVCAGRGTHMILAAPIEC